ncbi:YVTN family beta-propeller protein [Pseudomonas baetica]|uniref:YVTN family beta-propeller protein n=1 Tax=Pseudomonas baetica TaxID=674054 RepID=A0ABX4Q848_9PSED|nr:YncE family protein [Pseudomonas baetica]PKA72977.1 YVTN family beta-propeller protein [Pseudomonas baetica]
MTITLLNSTQADEALALSPMFIPGWQASVQPPGTAHGGIPQAIYQLPEGLLVVIDPARTLSTAMAAYDVVEMWVNGKPTSIVKIINPGEENDRFAMRLAVGWLLNGINQLFYRVSRLGGNFEDSRPILDVLYHDPAPGYPAPSGITVIHPVSVGPVEAAKGVEITVNVSFVRAFDEIVLTIGTWRRPITVTDPTQPITFMLTTADFQQIGDNQRMPISARVIDQLSNSNASATTYMNIHVSQSPGVVAFLNGPYSVVAGGEVKEIDLSLTEAGRPSAGLISLTLPEGAEYPDGEGGTRSFPVGADGRVTVSGVRAGNTPGVFSLTASSGGGTASAVLTITEQMPVGPIALDPVPTGITLSPDNTLAFVTGAGSVQIIDTSTSQRIKKIDLPQLSVSWEIAVNGDASRVFACNGNNAVMVIDIATSSMIANIPVAGHPIGIVMSKNGLQAFVSTWGGNSVGVIDVVNSRAVKTIPVGSHPRGIALSPDGRWVYVANNNNFSGVAGSSISIISTLTLSVVRTVPMPLEAYGVDISPDGKSFYVCGRNQATEGFVLQYDTQTFVQIRAIRVIGLPRGIVLDPSGTQAYCCDRDTNTVSTIDTASGQVIATTTVGQGPLEIAISKDGKLGYVTCYYDNTVWVFSLMSGASGLGTTGAMFSGFAVSSPQTREPIPGDAY